MMMMARFWARCVRAGAAAASVNLGLYRVCTSWLRAAVCFPTAAVGSVNFSERSFTSHESRRTHPQTSASHNKAFQDHSAEMVSGRWLDRQVSRAPL